MPSESKTKGSTRQTCSTVYGRVALPVASATPPTRIVEFVPETVTVCGWGAGGAEPDGLLAQAAAPARNINERKRIESRASGFRWQQNARRYHRCPGVPKAALRT